MQGDRGLASEGARRQRCRAPVVVVGEVVGVHIDDAFLKDGLFDTVKAGNVARLGYMDYSSVERCSDAPAALEDGLGDTRGPRPRQQPLGAAADAGRSYIWPSMPTTPGLPDRREGRDDRLGMRDRLGRRGERLVDDRHLVRVDRHLAGEAVALGLQALALAGPRCRENSTKTVSMAGTSGRRCRQDRHRCAQNERRRCSGRARRASLARRSRPTDLPRPRSVRRAERLHRDSCRRDRTPAGCLGDDREDPDRRRPAGRFQPPGRAAWSTSCCDVGAAVRTSAA